MVMNSNQARQTFLDFFREKAHQIVPSAPMVIKNDPTLMFTNAGMNQFKDLFLGNAPVKFPRVADTQKCLRVSGKHNDLEEVGVDTYHHTMFEMLGNWSFGDYFKKEAIEWAWELLTEVYKIPVNRIYVTVFEGSSEDNLDFDKEASDLWTRFVAPERIIKGSKKDNFWEMGDTGPCGPCSEIHVDIRSDEHRNKIDGRDLVNCGHPQVIEIWNLVFMEFNRKADGSLEKLPARHVDTGMGFERLCMVLQNKQSNYDTDVFSPLLDFISAESGVKYGSDASSDIAFRVMADHIRTIAFAICDGQLPSNNKAGYVIRRILRRAVRYYFSFLDIKEPFLFRMIPVLSGQMGGFFPELKNQQTLIMNVIREEEQAFLRTLGSGIQKFRDYAAQNPNGPIDGIFAFELYDTYGFPLDLTELMAREINRVVDLKSFDESMQAQKNRSRAAALVDTDDWVILRPGTQTVFLGYDILVSDSEVLRYRKVSQKGKTFFQIVLDQTPFYAESGGQTGDTGYLQFDSQKILVLDTKKENGIWYHLTSTLPSDIQQPLLAVVDQNRRDLIACNHTATHLMHAALRGILGTHVEQKGSLVNPDYLRFDFSHFAKTSDEQISAVEALVNKKIRENIRTVIENMSVDEAMKSGAMALFGEKYGDVVRVVTLDPDYSIELCGGTHVKATGELGYFKIISESAVAAGVRRIEALTSQAAEKFLQQGFAEIQKLNLILKNPKELSRSVEQLMEQQNRLQKKIEQLYREKTKELKESLITQSHHVANGMAIIASVSLDAADALKDLCFQLKETDVSLVVVLCAEVDGKPMIHAGCSSKWLENRGLSAVEIIKTLAPVIKGGGGGQPFYASAGGSDKSGLSQILGKANSLLTQKTS